MEELVEFKKIGSNSRRDGGRTTFAKMKNEGIQDQDRSRFATGEGKLFEKFTQRIGPYSYSKRLLDPDRQPITLCADQL